MRVINIIDSAQKINFGIWNAAINTAPILKQNHNVDSELWFPQQKHDIQSNGYKIVQFPKKPNTSTLIKEYKLDPDKDIIVTHGCWRIQTLLGARFKKLGFKWIYVPHGMLEPWSLKQKALKKKIYFNLYEGRLAMKSDLMRSVGMDEHKNLKQKFSKHPNLKCIPNGIPKNIYNPTHKKNTVKKVLYMGRLHHKKGPYELVQAWVDSKLNNNSAYELLIAGPDEGELEKIVSVISNSKTQNIQYIGAIYGKEKENLFNECTFFALPSKSEGFPTSILEGMNYGLIPLISYGCNFSQLLDENYAINTGTTKKEIAFALDSLLKMTPDKLKQKSIRGKQLVDEQYTYESIAAIQNQVFSDLLVKNSIST